MGSQHTRMEQAADRRLDREQRTERKHSTVNATANRVETGPEDEVPIAEWNDAIRVLGQPPRGPLFVTGNLAGTDHEYEVHGRVSPAQYNDAPRPGELWLHRREQVAEVGRGAFVDDYHVRCREVPVGTYARRMRQAEILERRNAARRGEAPAHPVDLMSELDWMRAKPATFEVLGGVELDNADEVGPGVDLLRKSLRRLDRPGQEAIRGPRAILDALTLAGVDLTLHGDTLLIEAKRLTADVREVIDAAAPLLKAELAGKPLRCVKDHRGEAPEAVTIAYLDAPLCAECAS